MKWLIAKKYHLLVLRASRIGSICLPSEPAHCYQSELSENKRAQEDAMKKDLVNADHTGTGCCSHQGIWRIRSGRSQETVS
jgi:hypothetical protein